MNWFKEIFKKLVAQKSDEPAREKCPCGSPTCELTRIRVDDGFFGTDGVLNHPENYGSKRGFVIKRYAYFCNCGTRLTDGPCGGAAVNAVCEKCRKNYGCLPGYEGEW